MNPALFEMAVASLLFAIMGTLVKLASQAQVPVGQVVFLRSGLGFLLLLVGAGFLRIPLSGSNRRSLIVRSVSGCIALSLYFFAISRIPLADAVLLNYTSPFFATLFAWMFLREPVSRSTALSLAVAFMGVLLVLRPTGQWDLVGSLAGLLSGGFAGAAYVAVRQMRSSERPWVIVTWLTAVASALTLPWAVAEGAWPRPEAWPMLLGVALSATVAQLFMTRAYRGVSTSVGSTASLLTVALAALFAWLFLGEPPHLSTVAGGTLILGSSLWLARGTPPDG